MASGEGGAPSAFLAKSAIVSRHRLMRRRRVSPSLHLFWLKSLEVSVNG